MIRFAIILFLMLHGLASQLTAQDDIGALKKRIVELEAENRKLRGLVITLPYTRQLHQGVRAIASMGDGRTARLVVARAGWGDASADDVAAVCVSCAETIFQAIRPDKGREPTLFIVRDKQGPMVLSQRAADGEYIVLLDAGDRHWSQVAYQFSHELGHVLCGDLSVKAPQLWFEEAFCESLSLWTMDKMGVSWQTKAPYDNWKAFAPSLTTYIDEVRKRVPDPSSLPDWYQQHRTHLTREAYDREKNLVLAKQLAAAAHKNPDFYQAFYHLRRGEQPQVNSIEWLLASWLANCPPKLQFAPEATAKFLGVTPRK